MRFKPYGVGFFVQCFQFIVFGMLEQPVDSSLSTDECASRGFGSQLMCGSCALLPQFKLSALEEDCMQCCQKEVDDDDSKKYPQALLEVCG